MSLIRIIFGLVCIVVICLGCPHPSFVIKHICTTCYNNPSDVNHFAVQVDAWRRQQHPNQRRFTHKNSVFIARKMRYRHVTIAGKHYCVFRNRARKYNCEFNVTLNTWGCQGMARFYAYHDPVTGHYFPLKDR